MLKITEIWVVNSRPNTSINDPGVLVVNISFSLFK